MRLLTTAILILALTLLGGCARSTITTEIKSGGAWTRTVGLTGQQKQEGGMDMGTALEDAFNLPSGDGWKSTEKKKDSDRTVTFEKSFTAGNSSKGDLSIKGPDPAKPLLVNEVTVKSVGQGRFEYRETLRWEGPSKNIGAEIKPEDLAQLKAALPKALATDENARAIAAKTAVLAVPMMFGPNDPLLALGLMHPDLAARRASQRIGGLMLKALEEQFGDKMQPAERREVTRKLIETVFSQAKPSKPDPAAGPPSGKHNTGLTPLMFVVRTSGKVISSNGEKDELTGEVYWAMFPEGASLQPVVLTAVIQP